jgi:quinolinate synthase
MYDIEALGKRVRELAKAKNAVILAHNYQRGEVLDVADHTGDSLGLSQIAASVEAEVIVFCGVHFMAESAAILAPEKKVLLPRMDAGCPMADMICEEDLLKVKEQYPGVPIVTYVNSSAAVKAVSDVCCTSANAVKVTKATGAPHVYLAPDKNLAQWVARHTDQKVSFWQGYCPTHENLTAKMVIKAKKENPGAPFVAHPECRPEVIDLADEVRSTSGMIEYCKNSTKRAIIIGTEIGLIHQLELDSPGKRFISPSERLICPNMKLTNLEDVIEVLENMSNVITVDEKTRLGAKIALE